jgi:hypothetical protein
MIAMDSDWIVLESASVLSACEEFEWDLCIRQQAGLWEMAICVAGPLAEIPTDWYDDETGELKSEYQDGNGCLRLPLEIDGAIATGYDGCYLLGGLTPHPNYDIVEMNDLGKASIDIALQYLDWQSVDLDRLKEKIEKAPGR